MEKIKCEGTLVDVQTLVENPKNPNKHGDKQIKMLSKIIDYQGQRLPIVVSKRSGFIVAGHGRLQAIKMLGWDKCAVSYQDFDSEAQEYAHMIADNKIAELAEHDDNLMIEGIKELDIDDFELLGLSDFTFLNLDAELDDKQKSEDVENKFIIEVQFPNDMEMMDVHDDLVHRGYLVKIK